MVENNEKGRQVRKYFIKCEKQLMDIMHQRYYISTKYTQYALENSVAYRLNRLLLECQDALYVGQAGHYEVHS